MLCLHDIANQPFSWLYISDWSFMAILVSVFFQITALCELRLQAQSCGTSRWANCFWFWLNLINSLKIYEINVKISLSLSEDVFIHKQMLYSLRWWKYILEELTGRKMFANLIKTKKDIIYGHLSSAQSSFKHSPSEISLFFLLLLPGSQTQENYNDANVNFAPFLYSP